MDTQTLRTPLIVFTIMDLAPAQPVQACSRDYGFDFDQDEIVREMLAPLPAALSAWALSQLNADEPDFDALRFLS